ncbi:helix-turn-helix domain-containing protein [Schaalia radingae]|nr:helix-turn-helix transcriptional regulator [Schaalia radingae]
MKANIAYRQYPPERPKKMPPLVSIRALRTVAGLTLDELAQRIEKEVPELKVSRGTLCAIENGSRGVSDLMSKAIARAFGLDDDALITTYKPRASAQEKTAS